MTQTINVLIVEDEPLIINALENALHQISENNGLFEFKISSATNCDSALLEIQKAVKTQPFDLVLLDISIPESSNKEFLSGEDIGVNLRHLFPKVKIMVFTSHNSNYRLNNILKSINPEGFLIKSDIDYNKLITAINAILNDELFYSTIIMKLVRRHISNDFVLDQLDRQLIFHISKGSKMKELAEILPLSKSAMEYRKRNLKQLFDIEDGNDRDLILKAEQYGYI